MRGRGLMLVAGMRMGENRAQAAQAQQQAAQAQAQQQKPPQPPAAPSPAPPTAPPPPPKPDTMAELQKLADLHNSGVLTDEEFAAAKKKLLS